MTIYCPFCQLPPERIIAQNAHALVILDGFPVSPGHTLIIPKRHVGSFFETTQDEKVALLELLDEAKTALEQSPPDAQFFCHIAEHRDTSKVRTEDTPLYRTTDWNNIQNRKPHSYNIGINDGPAAGQTVPHLHIHLIPRYKNDVDDPRGGVRWVVPKKADYWSVKG
jgi:diadenosine tetraphosphate (Ap4A) HIT family hydrolase